MIKKSSLIFFLFTVFFTKFLNAQEVPVSSTPIISFQVSSIENEKALIDIYNLLITHYGEKIVNADYDFQKSRINVTGNSNFNAREILEFFRNYGKEAYYIEFGVIKRLSQDGTLIESIKYNEN